MPSTRREFLSGACAAGAALLLPSHAESAPVGTGGASKPFTFVHLTDIHLTTRRQGDKGYRACIESIRALDPMPDFLLMGGDLAFDGCYTPKEVFERDIRLYKEITESLGIPYYNCMGNHDVLGWSPRRKVSLDDPDLGKKMIMDRLGWKKSYYSFDHGGWHFVVLDSTFPIDTPEGPLQEPRIGPEQLAWLGRDLGRAAGRPTVAVVHVAVFCNEGQISGDTKRLAMDGMVLRDNRALREMLERHQVKALLQGHSHRIEDYFFNGIWYVTSAAAGGAWWAGSWTGSPPGYTVFRCEGEKLTWEHKTYEWEPRLDPADTLERKRIAEQKEFEERQRRLLEEERAAGQAE
ncbi:MAG: metallophosphoesterase [Phycisphaerae bacterium]|jgi:3',5'-cyclic AMP phosphodiesterase CpdA|nr:metallophosphoesterase [Phycisphaerae bacterium]HOL26160.1 metallophosphoesterase [Phycisphaerae bacterium]HPP20147.1 metallophosphoesterase [Phycisphaerae bacterium]